MFRLRSCASSMISVSYWREVLVARQLGQQDPVGHQLDHRGVADLVGEAHLPADRAAELDAQLLGDPGRHRAGGEAPRLGVADHPVHAAAQLQADLGDLGGLPGAGLAGDDHDLVVADRVGDLLAARADRQCRGVVDAGQRGPSPGDPVLRGGDGVRDALLRASVAGAVQAVAQPIRLGRAEAADALAQRVQRIAVERRRCVLVPVSAGASGAGPGAVGAPRPRGGRRRGRRRVESRPPGRPRAAPSGSGAACAAASWPVGVFVIALTRTTAGRTTAAGGFGVGGSTGVGGTGPPAVVPAAAGRRGGRSGHRRFSVPGRPEVLEPAVTMVIGLSPAVQRV